MVVLYANRTESAVGPSHIESSCDCMIYLLIQSVCLMKLQSAVIYSRLQLHNCARLVDVGVRDRLKCYPMVSPLTLNVKSSLNTNYLELTQWQSRSPGCTSGRTSGATATQQAAPLSTRYTNKVQVSHKVHPQATPYQA